MAARTSVTPGLLASSSRRKAYGRSAKTQVIQGVPVTATTGAEQILIGRLNKKLQKRGLKPRCSPTRKIKEVASDTLGVAGICVASQPELKKKTFSLINTQLDTETIENPSILNPSQYKDIVKRKITLETMFSNPSDPFYTTDGPFSVSRQKRLEEERVKRQPDLTGIAAEMIRKTNSSSHKTIRAYSIGGR
tara:strand:+ start:4728 stop:5303 length:576 start_codon:yes stop_codon:yes gene_type:complete